ncbi:uncharacterized protein [Primulina eburnea]|uniref:uncharacterized protein n=1 Tax=Primulina eburnea TaxID=1245227 RepID=UPI003C6CB508
MPPKRKNVEGDDSTPPTDKTTRVVDEFTKLLQEQAKVHGEQIQKLLTMQTTIQGQVQERVQGTTNSSENGAYDRFRRMNPPEFIGGPDPLVALEWVKALEAIFDYLKFTDQEKVGCAVFMLVKAARIWWKATKVTINVKELKWNEFKYLFHAKYFSREIKAKKVKEFIELRQASLSVAEYILKFEEGCVFVPFIAKNDKDKGEHFLRGLKPEIIRDVHMSKVVTYQEIVERALLAEHDEQEIEKERQLRRQVFQAKGQGSSVNVRGGYKGKGKMEQRSRLPLPPTDSERPLCPKCGKPHKGECLIGSGRCYICKEMGHTVYNCPLSFGKGKVQGRIFTITKEGANPDASVISGNIFILGKEALTLIDTGATHSFISEEFMHTISVKPTLVPVEFNIVLPSGEEIWTNSMFKACPVLMGSRLLYTDLIVITMVAFDVILGMDWLSAYRAVINCVSKTVKFLADDYEKDLFVGVTSSLSIPIISCLQATKLLHKGCVGYLASVLDTRKESRIQLQDIDVVQDYPDVFEEDVPGLPPDREVEFVIDLIPGTAPISKAPYRLAPTEMKELKNQLQELLDKDALSRKSSSELNAMISKPLFLDLQRNEINLVSSGTVARLSTLVLRSTLFDRILKEQQSDVQLLKLKRSNELTGVSEFGLNRDGLMTFRGKICVPIGDNIRRDVLIEAHTAPYSVHPGGTKMYQDLRRLYWWPEVGERKMLGPELIQQTAEVVALIQERMKTAQSRQKSYADVRRRPLAFEVGDHVFIKIAPLKGVMRFGKKGKLSPRYIGPFEILDKIGDRAYRLALPPDLDRIHNVFHVSMLRKYLANPSHVLRYESLELLPNLSYDEMPVQIIDRKVKVLRNKEIGIVKVLWRNQVIEEATWEPEEEMKQRYPNLFDSR